MFLWEGPGTFLRYLSCTSNRYHAHGTSLRCETSGDGGGSTTPETAVRWRNAASPVVLRSASSLGTGVVPVRWRASASLPAFRENPSSTGELSRSKQPTMIRNMRVSVRRCAGGTVG